MARLNLVLYLVLILTALGSITAQHKARKLYFELQQQQEAAKQYEVEWGQLQLEQSTWAMHARIEAIAMKQLHMQVPDAARVQVIEVLAQSQRATKAAGESAPPDANHTSSMTISTSKTQ